MADPSIGTAWDWLIQEWRFDRDSIVEFLIVEPDPEHMLVLLELARSRLGDDPQITEFNEEYMDAPVDDPAEAIDRLMSEEAFFVNVEGAIDDIPVTVSLAPDHAIVKFAATDVIRADAPPDEPPAAFSALAAFAVELAETALADAVTFGGEGVENATEEWTALWEGAGRPETPPSSEARELFAEYVRVLDPRFREKKFVTDEQLAASTGASRVYRRRQGMPMAREETFYSVRLFGADVRTATIDREVARASRSRSARWRTGPDSEQCSYLSPSSLSSRSRKISSRTSTMRIFT